MKTQRLLSRVVLVLAVCWIACACGSKSYTLRLAPKEGETYSYTMKVTGGQNMEVQMSMKAVKVASNQVVFDSTIGGMKLNGQPLPSQASDLFKSMNMKITMDGTGHTLNTEVTGVPEAMAASMKQQASGSSTSFPDKPVKVGDSWAAETNMGGEKAKVTFKFAKVDTVQGKEAAILEGTLAPGSNLTLDGPMRVSIDLANGMMISTSFAGTANGQKVAVDMTRN